jgi:predicted nucleic acid-binding protein
MKVLVDTNVLLDVAFKRLPHYTDSKLVMRWCQHNPGCGVVAWHTISNAYYLLKSHRDGAGVRAFTEVTARDFIETVLEIFEVIATGTAVAKHALRLDVKDFEDALQISAAVWAGVDEIITGDQAHFSGAPLSVRTPGEFVDSQMP